MKLFKLIEINLEMERRRIERKGQDQRRVYNKKQRAALRKLCDLFEAGEWQKCLDHANNKAAFPYNEEGEYPETEHIGAEIVSVLRGLSYETFFTQQELITEIEGKLLANSPKRAKVAS